MTGKQKKKNENRKTEQKQGNITCCSCVKKTILLLLDYLAIKQVVISSLFVVRKVLMPKPKPQISIEHMDLSIYF